MHCNNCGCEFDAQSGKCPVCGMKVEPEEKDTSQGNVNLNKEDKQEIPKSGFGEPGFYNKDNSEESKSKSDSQDSGSYNQGPMGGMGMGMGGMGGMHSGMGGMGMGMGGMWGMGHTPPQTDAPDYMTYLIISILYTVCCCNWIIGVIGIILCVQMNTAYKTGDFHSYKSLKNVIVILFIVGIVLYALSFIGIISFGLLDSLLSIVY